MRRRDASLVGAALCALAAIWPAMPRARAATPPPASLHFRVLVHTGKPLGSIVWTGSRFIYALEGSAQLYASGPEGAGFSPFARLPRNGGEMRCALSPGSHGWPAGTLYCHASEGPIYRLPADGGPISVFARVPSPRPSDGALSFDAVGGFGYALLAATGGSDSGPGVVFAIDPDARVRTIGSYAGPGGAEQIAVAPAGFGSAAGQALMSIDEHDRHGRLLAMDAHGAVHALLGDLPWGLNPIAPLAPNGVPAGIASGLYVIDWLSHDVLFAPASDLRPYLGGLLVATERHGSFYLLRAAGSHYSVSAVHTDLRAHDYNLEGVQYLPA